MFTLPVHSSPLPLPAFSIIREITHFPSNLTPQNLRKRIRARSLAKLHSRDTHRNTRFNIQCTAFDSNNERTTRRTAYETIVLFCPFSFSDFLPLSTLKLFILRRKDNFRCANSFRTRYAPRISSKSNERHFSERENRNFCQ